EQDKDKLENKFRAYICEREAGSLGRSELSVLQSENLIPETQARLSESFNEGLLERLEGVPEYHVKPKPDDSVPFTLEYLLNLVQSYFLEFSRDALSTLQGVSVEPEDFVKMIYAYYMVGTTHPLSENAIAVLEYGKEKILDFVLSQKETEFHGQGLYILPDFQDYLERENTFLQN
ncbi:MAG: hypothetical protein AABX05_03690, partial [Nanoarchaeota archaeon]